MNQVRPQRSRPWINSSINDERFRESIDAPIDESTNLLINDASKESFNEWANGSTTRWIDETSMTHQRITNESTNEWRSEWIHPSMDGCMHGRINRCPRGPLNATTPIPNAHELAQRQNETAAGRISFFANILHGEVEIWAMPIHVQK